MISHREFLFLLFGRQLHNEFAKSAGQAFLVVVGLLGRHEDSLNCRAIFEGIKVNGLDTNPQRYGLQSGAACKALFSKYWRKYSNGFQGSTASEGIFAHLFNSLRNCNTRQRRASERIFAHFR